MERIPEILHTAPADQKEMSVLILIQLINLPNAFNIEVSSSTLFLSVLRPHRTPLGDPDAG